MSEACPECEGTGVDGEGDICGFCDGTGDDPGAMA